VYQLLYARMRHTKHYLTSVKQLSQNNNNILNISSKKCSCVLIEHRDGFTYDQWKTVFHLLSENRLNDEQFGFFCGYA
jgi:hypothetical protein